MLDNSLRCYWQFKNGTIGSLPIKELTNVVLRGMLSSTKIHYAWDRSLGGWMFYEV